MVSTTSREQLLTELYESMFPVVAKYVARMGGTFDDAKDIFHDALVVYYEKVIAGDFEVSNNKAYLTGIAKHLWFKKFNEQTELKSIDDNSFDIADEADEQPSTKKILHYLQTAGKRCMDILCAFYYDKLAMRDVAEKFGYAGERSVTVQKYKCLEKVRETVKQQSLEYADFVE
ncbi:sigma-70 family RNA polymerase sigma factor [Mucilaginibacter sp. 21P]|uniref:RNA polymerase sigma factor n=1 Tax=Mucilaginibacter sp. 21P TaxID=2778902 RepID=UPI001C56F2A2|nr:sigma-70 family RNA polymerase sigma factor [Mucilaginibacter sp. 21P]QXV65021.1 sigma-70 family RNA polymerase sigma factor [Mucilaginibacter sp. 21P]